MKLLSALIFMLIICGILARRTRKSHVTLMLLAMAADLGLVLYIELTRDAIRTALNPPHPLIIVHVALSVGVVIAYFLQAGMGIQMLRTRRRIVGHRWVAIAFLFFRFGNLITSFFIDQTPDAAPKNFAPVSVLGSVRKA